jgi:hypothetical protein
VSGTPSFEWGCPVPVAACLACSYHSQWPFIEMGCSAQMDVGCHSFLQQVRDTSLMAQPCWNVGSIGEERAKGLSMWPVWPSREARCKTVVSRPGSTLCRLMQTLPHWGLSKFKRDRLKGDRCPVCLATCVLVVFTSLIAALGMLRQCLSHWSDYRSSVIQLWAPSFNLLGHLNAALAQHSWPGDDRQLVPVQSAGYLGYTVITCGHHVGDTCRAENSPVPPAGPQLVMVTGCGALVRCRHTVELSMAT